DGKRVDDTPPKEDAVLLLRDFQFELQGHLKKGTRVIKVQSSGPRYTKPTSFDSTPAIPLPMSSVGTRTICTTPRLLMPSAAFSTAVTGSTSSGCGTASYRVSTFSTAPSH